MVDFLRKIDEELSIINNFKDNLLSSSRIVGPELEMYFAACDDAVENYDVMVISNQSGLALIRPHLARLWERNAGSPLPQRLMELQPNDALLVIFDPRNPDELLGATLIHPTVLEGSRHSQDESPWHKDAPGNTWVLEIEMVASIFPKEKLIRNAIMDGWKYTGARGAAAVAIAGATTYSIKETNHVMTLRGSRIWQDVVLTRSPEFIIAENDQPLDQQVFFLLDGVLDSAFELDFDGVSLTGLDNICYQPIAA